MSFSANILSMTTKSVKSASLEDYEEQDFHAVQIQQEIYFTETA